MTHSLVLIEHSDGQLKSASLRAITLARQLGGTFSVCLLGHGINGLADKITSWGAEAVLVADHTALNHPLADRYAAVIAQIANACRFDTIIGTASTFTKDILPRTAGLLEWPMLSDVLRVEQREGVTFFDRPVYAGGAVATVRLEGDGRVLTIRPAAFELPSPGNISPVEKINIDPARLPDGTEFIVRQILASDRPELTEARIVVGGGRPLKDRETFERLIGGLADALGAGVATTRAAVDAGIAPNDWQVGQTGKVIAPDLYIAVGISGAIQHLAGIKDAKTIVAINRDPEAPIFKAATYGLVGDFHQILPELIQSVRQS